MTRVFRWQSYISAYCEIIDGFWVLVPAGGIPPSRPDRDDFEDVTDADFDTKPGAKP